MKNFDYKDINLIPKLGIVKSRALCETNVTLGKYTFKAPIVPANMECVIDTNLAIKLAKNKFFYILHRFYNTDEIISFIKQMNNENLYTSISIGVTESWFRLIDSIKENNLNVDYITIDIAHGHSLLMKKTIEYVRKVLGDDVFIIAGNVSTQEGVLYLEECGADCVKVGIAPGAACLTAMNVGFGSRGTQASTVQKCAQISRKPIIADGGIKLPSDISKAIVMGATMVMIGSMLTGYNDSPNSNTLDNGLVEYWGSASEKQTGKYDGRIEGTIIKIPFKDISLIEHLKFIIICLQSAISYGGGYKLQHLWEVEYDIINN